MRLNKYLKEMGGDDSSKFISKWKSELKGYGLTHVEFSTHFIKDRLNHPRNKPPITLEEMDFMVKGFLKKVGTQFRKDIEDVKNHRAKPRGKNRKKLNYNEIEFAIWNPKSTIKFVMVLKQDRKEKGTAMILPMTIIRDKTLKHTQGELVEI